METKSLRKAINEMCRQCMTPETKSIGRKEILHCQGYSCGLYGVRPIPKDAKVDSNMKPMEA